MFAATRIITQLPSAKLISLIGNEIRQVKRWVQIGILGGAALLTVGVVAQLAGGDRGVAPLDSASSFEVSGVSVDETGDNAQDARLKGWREAQREGWAMLWQKMHGSAGPMISDGALDSMIEAIVVEDEQVSEHRYIAKLGILFDRVRSSEVLGVTGTVVRSPPLLVIPVMWEGGTAQVFETRTPWQRAWANFRAGNSPINYVRPSGTGVDPLLINAAQADRRGRGWWRMLLDQYGAADVVIPQVRLEHQWPGGPVIGYFTARYGPENKVLGSFVLRVANSAALPKLLDVGVQRIDALYTAALNSGQLKPDRSLILETPVAPEIVENTAAPTPLGSEIFNNAAQPETPTTAQQFTVRFVTPEAADVATIEAAVKRVPGVKSSNTSSIAVGGTSVMSVEFSGDLGALKIGLAAHGFHVEDAGGVLQISRSVPKPSEGAPGQ